MAPPRSPRMQVLIYLLLAFAFSSFFYFLILHSGSLGNGRGRYVLGLLWCPALAGMLTLRRNGRSVSELGWKWGETKYQIQSWLIPLLLRLLTSSSGSAGLTRLSNRCILADQRGFRSRWAFF
jgi:uncharacterized protein